MRKSIILFLALTLIASLLAGCSKSELSKTYMDAFSKQYSNKFIVKPVQYKFTSLNELTPSNIKLPDDDNLSFVQNLPKLDNSCMDALMKYHFYVNETDYKEFYDIYEDNNILPTFITTDSVAHSYHQIFDYSLKLVEQKYLSTLTKKLSEDMLASSINIYNNVKDQKTKKAALKNIAYFNTAEALSNGKINEAVPSEALKMTNAELKSINEAKGYEDSSIFPYQIDYSQFKVRGHYTENEALQRYFKAMMWFSNIPFAFEINENGKTIRADEQIIQ